MNNRKLGRPPATSSDQTRTRILDTARKCFATHGYEATTNRELAESAELTTGAIYHYFGSKLELYLEVHRRVQLHVYDRFEKAITEVEPTFVANIDAVLDEARALNQEDPSLAQFLVAVRTDAGRHPELAQHPSLEHDRRGHFFGSLIELGVRTGELRPEDAELTSAVITAVLMGLQTASSDNPETHARAIEGIKRLVAGSLIQTQASDPSYDGAPR
jgi:AcrR family transcriptional regulator